MIYSLVSESSIQSKNQALADVELKKCNRGMYAWFFKKLPPQLDEYHDRFLKREEKWLLYVGICPSSPVSNRKLRDRIRTHYSGNAYGSTLRLSLGCLLSDYLGITLQVMGKSKNRLTFGEDEKTLSKWMKENAFVAWIQHDSPWTIEEDAFKVLDLPLNLKGNQHNDFYADLRAIRAKASEAARELFNEPCPCAPCS
jgi:hypothetical protein